MYNLEQVRESPALKHTQRNAKCSRNFPGTCVLSFVFVIFFWLLLVVVLVVVLGLVVIFVVVVFIVWLVLVVVLVVFIFVFVVVFRGLTFIYLTFSGCRVIVLFTFITRLAE